MNEENLKIIFGIKIKSYRTHLGLSLQELSKKTTIAVSYLSEIESGKKFPKPEKLIRLQKIEFVKSGASFLLLSMARPLSLSKTRGSAIALGIKIDKTLESAIKFINDPGIETEKVSGSCERCPLTDCSERVVEVSLISKQNALEKREAALQKFIGYLKEPINL